MRKIIGIFGAVAGLICTLLLQSCNPPWEEHFVDQEDHVKMKLWEAINMDSRFSTFVSEMQATGLDTIFQDEQIYTLFIPVNEAFELVQDTGNFMRSILKYHISKTLFIDRNVHGYRRLLTSSGKYALIEAEGSSYTFDGIPIEESSPLFLNGKYYVLPAVAIPKSNLYEFVSQNSSILKFYIDSKDSVYLDRSLSTPIGFTEDGKTIYDSVFRFINTFEEEYFPVSKEFRNESATFVIFTQDQYLAALDDMASKLGGNITDHNDIPTMWQYNVFLPDFISKAMFKGNLSYDDLSQGMIQCISGDSVEVNAEIIDPGSRYICSNGVAYLYHEFYIADELFRGTSTKEGEMLIDSIGAGKFTWKPDIITTGAIIEPLKNYSGEASNGSLISVPFDRNYKGEYSLEFAIKNLFPMRYRLEWRAYYRPSGIYEVYVNDQILKYKDKFGNTLTAFDTYELRNSVLSVTGERFFPNLGFNTRDYWIENLTDYGDVRIRFKYIGPGGSSSNGFNIDYVRLIPDF